MNNRKITDILDDALAYPDYNKRINFMLAGLLSADANDTPEKEAVNMGYLREIYKYCHDYKGDKQNYFRHIADSIKGYLGE